MKHIIDTNYVIRLITNDIPSQREIVLDFLKRSKEKNEDVYFSIISFFEVIWVMESTYSFLEEETILELEKLYKSNYIIFENEEILLPAIINSKKNNLGLEDNYILALAKENGFQLHTFDKKLEKVWGKI